MRNLLRPPTEALIRDLGSAMRAVLDATPLSGNHLRDLPFAVRDLSRMLTQDRSQLARSYWINKRLLTAYCRYFLPWNLVRLSWLLPNLDLNVTAGDVILDLGSGPLTMPIALWLAKPEWRRIPLTVVCADIAPGPMAVGRDVFARLAGDSPWTIELRREPVDAALRGLAGQAKLITAANVVNEFKPSRETPLEKRLADFAARTAARLAPDGRFLAVEPGTRLGGKLMATLRHAAFASHLVPEGPCPHWGACPMLTERATGWCHFTHTPEAAPKELAALTIRSKLEKHSLSLSCMLMRGATEEEKARASRYLPALADDDLDEDFGTDEENFDDGTWGEEAEVWADAYAECWREAARERQVFVRVISDPIRIPDAPGAARYCCSDKGLVLAHGALRIPSGAAVAARWPERETRDAKTGALEITVAAPETGDRERSTRAKIPPHDRRPGGNGTKQAGQRAGRAQYERPNAGKKTSGTPAGDGTAKGWKTKRANGVPHDSDGGSESGAGSRKPGRPSSRKGAKERS